MNEVYYSRTRVCDSYRSLCVKGEVIRELTRHPCWRKELDEARTTAETMKIIEEFGKAEGHIANVEES